MRNKGFLEDFRRASPNFLPEDNVGSSYCVRRYVVDDRIGGPRLPAKSLRSEAAGCLNR